MSISYPLSLPNVKAPAAIVVYADTVTSVSVSPFTLKQQIHVFDGQQWKAEISLPRMKQEDAQVWQAFLTALRGVEGTFLMGDSSKTSPLGVASGSPQIRTNQSAGIETILTKGWTPSITNILKAGDMIQIASRLHQVLLNTNSDGSGYATLEIFPRLREAVSNSDTIITNNPKGLFRLSGSSQRVSVADNAKLQLLSYKAIEAI